MSGLAAILFLGGSNYFTISLNTVLEFISYFHLFAIIPYNSVFNTYGILEYMFNNPAALGALAGFF